MQVEDLERAMRLAADLRLLANHLRVESQASSCREAADLLERIAGEAEIGSQRPHDPLTIYPGDGRTSFDPEEQDA